MKESNKILTISVAAYNLGEMIEDNLKSFIQSDVKELIEVIVTDDGSKDNTAEIVEKYAKEYPGIIKLIKQKNAGAGSTVNSGIKNATGKYFKIVDGDDWVETKNLNDLVSNLQKIDADIVLTNYEIYDESKKMIINTSKLPLEKNKKMNFEKICKNIHLDMHNVTYKTSIFKENNIILDNGFYTDVEYLLLPTSYLKNGIYYDIDLYVYRVAREGQSVSLPSMQKNLNMHDLVLKRLIKYYEDNKNIFNENVKNYISKRIADMADTQLMTILTFKDDKELKNKVKGYFKEIKFESEDIYNKFKKGKKEKLILLSRFNLINLATKMVIKKF